MLIADAKHVESALDVGGEVEVAHTFKQSGEELVARRHGGAKAHVVGVEVAEQPLHIAFARCADGALLNGTKIVGEGGVELWVVFRGVGHIDEKL